MKSAKAAQRSGLVVGSSTTPIRRAQRRSRTPLPADLTPLDGLSVSHAMARKCTRRNLKPISGIRTGLPLAPWQGLARAEPHYRQLGHSAEDVLTGGTGGSWNGSPAPMVTPIIPAPCRACVIGLEAKWASCKGGGRLSRAPAHG